MAARLGLAWDVLADHRTVLRAHYGRYHDQPFSYIYSWHDVSGISPSIWLAADANGQLVEVRRSVAPDFPAISVDPSLKQSHVDQVLLGVERQAFSDVALEARYVHRRFGNFIGYVDNRLSDWTPFPAQDPGPDGELGTADDGQVLTGYVPYYWAEERDSGGVIRPGQRDLTITNPPGAFRNYHGMQFIARKRHSRGFQGEVSYTWSRSRETVPGERGTNAAFAGLSPLGIAGDRSLASQGPRRSLFDYREFKALGAWQAPWVDGFTLGGVYRWHTGSRWHRRFFAYDPVSDYVDYVHAEEPNSRQLPSVQALDVRAEKIVRFDGRQQVGLYADVLNVTNVGRPLAVQSFSGHQFGEPRLWTQPRTARLGVRYSF